MPVHEELAGDLSGAGTRIAKGRKRMRTLADRITDELQVLIGKPMGDCWRATNMQIFEFGPRHKFVNRKGEEVEGSDVRLHVQCRWRMVDAARILFGRDDLLRPADEAISLDDFDWDKGDSILDVVQRNWFAGLRAAPLHVVNATGDTYGGFRISFERDVALEAFPCDSDRGEYHEHWRLLGHRSDGTHFVITGYGIEDDPHELPTDR